MSTESQGTRIRTRATPAPSAHGRVPAATTGEKFMHTGADAARVRQQELERQQLRREKGYAPWRFRLRDGTNGDVILLDNELGPCFWEHAVPGPGNDWSKTVHELCPKEYEPCPLCAQQKESYYVMFMTVMDLRPYPKRDGTIVPHSRRLLAVKAQQQNYFVRLAERHNGNLRGVHLLMTREGSQSFQIGQAEEVGAYDEATLVNSFAHPEIRSQDGKVVKAANADLYHYDYDKVFTRPSGEDLRRRYGGFAPAGSTQETRDEWGGNAPGGQAGGTIQPQAQAQAPAPAPAPAPAQAPSAGIQRRATPPASAAPPADLDDDIPF